MNYFSKFIIKWNDEKWKSKVKADFLNLEANWNAMYLIEILFVYKEKFVPRLKFPVDNAEKTLLPITHYKFEATLRQRRLRSIRAQVAMNCAYKKSDRILCIF